MKKILQICTFLFAFHSLTAQEINKDSAWVVNNYYKLEKNITMRDGIKLFTAIYVPKDSSTKHPILFNRTPYSCAPYGENQFKTVWSRNTKEYFLQKYIMIYQDVRGCYMSEGTYEDIRPYNLKAHPIPPQGKEALTKDLGRDTDEATDTYDAIDWIIKNVPTHNGNVGMSGISYPGFYSTMGSLSGHPALKAVSPQAPVTDWFIGDDAHHNGAFFLMDYFGFGYSFGAPRPKPTTKDAPEFDYPTQDNYDFFLREGTLKSITKKYFGDTMKFWNEIMNHPNYDAFWKARAVTAHLKNIKPAILITGGLFDAEDCWGTWETYQTIEKQSPATDNKICVGPWFHGGWARTDGTVLGNIQFGKNVSDYYYKNVELPFFNYHLKKEGDLKNLAEATIFITGENKWHQFSEWPPKNIEIKSLYVNERSALRFTKPITSSGYEEYVSDPSKPVPYTENVHLGRTREYMTDDQRFASRRPDVLTFKTEILKEDITLAGPVIGDLLVSISTTDADFIVKLIDVFPDTFKYSPNDSYPMGGYQMLVRGEVMRGKFRNSLEKPEPFTPDKITQVKFKLPDVAHTFQKGHRIMVQIQSSWFPLVDRNPQQFVDIYKCEEKDFIKSTIKIHHSAQNASCIQVPVLKK